MVERNAWKRIMEMPNRAKHKNVVVDDLQNLSANRFVHAAFKNCKELVYAIAIQHFKALWGKVSVILLKN